MPGKAAKKINNCRNIYIYINKFRTIVNHVRCPNWPSENAPFLKTPNAKITRPIGK